MLRFWDPISQRDPLRELSRIPFGRHIRRENLKQRIFRPHLVHHRNNRQIALLVGMNKMRFQWELFSF
ncbi:Uncharacterised protein [Vibrio cholerae]|nr:Uncharacterised protein [Vibrio cholerae]